MSSKVLYFLGCYFILVVMISLMIKFCKWDHMSLFIGIKFQAADFFVIIRTKSGTFCLLFIHM